MILGYLFRKWYIRHFYARDNRSVSFDWHCRLACVHGAVTVVTSACAWVVAEVALPFLPCALCEEVPEFLLVWDVVLVVPTVVVRVRSCVGVVKIPHSPCIVCLN